ncbi:hypothetical protein LTR36_006048 [Oleoguttula mirabilis]|uniref:FAD/NAD(P)-binding domain-containing protein n=1 Tax=Oleoguttula mirabilis TaxID=1507867 RepID=A0AAV9JCL8_9PEZI|nr:hypothetical protein LTR36_006048 [Oleoguttula mirabilis]
MEVKGRKNIVIIGGSYGGVSIAHSLLKHALPSLPNANEFRIILISTAATALNRPACPRALISDDFFPQDKLFVDIPTIFQPYAPSDLFEFRKATVISLDHTERVITVELATGEVAHLPFYAAIIATGATQQSPLLGLSHDESHLRDVWQKFRTALPKAEKIVIAGGGPSAIETAGELGEYLNGRAGPFRPKPQHPKVDITVISSAANILPQLRNSIAESAELYLAQVGVTVLKGAAVKSTRPENVGTSLDNLTAPCTVTLANGHIFQADLYIPAYGWHPNTSFLPPTLLAPDGRVKVNPKTLRVDIAGPRIYAIGDAASAQRAAVHLTLAAVPILAANIKRDLLLDHGLQTQAAPADRELKVDTSETQLVPIGKGKGVGAFMGWRMPSIVVYWLKGRDYWLWTLGDLWSGKQWEKET